MADVLPMRNATTDPTPAQAPAATATDPLLVDAAALAVLLAVSLRTVRTWDAGGRLPRPVRVGGAVRWRLDEIRRWLDAGAPCRDEWEARKAAARK